MKAIILAAGRGSRMQSLTDEQPKCLVKLGGRHLIDWQTAALNHAGITDIGIVCGYRREAFSNAPYRLFENPDWKTTNMVSSLLCASEWLRQETCIVSYSDIFYPAEAVRDLSNTSADIVISYDVNWKDLWQKRMENPLDDAETFKRHENGTLIEIGKRPNSINDIQGQYMGLLKITPDGFSTISRYLETLSSEEVKKLDMTSLLGRLLDNKVRIHTVPFSGKWGEVDTVQDLETYQLMIAAGELEILFGEA